MPADRPGASLWDWSLATYERPGVAAACLALQDRHGLDVNLLLAAVWAGASGRGLDPAAMRELAASVARWHGEVVRPLRALRRRLKHDPHGIDAEAAGRVRARIAAVELDAEQAEQLAIEAQVLATASCDAARRANPRETARANLAALAPACGFAWAADDGRLLDLLVAAGCAGDGCAEDDRTDDRTGGGTPV
ncbi:MAG: TIGR02444 family protein [Alphaproteobacteria bacterium]